MSIKDFKILKMIGKGAFGRVELVERKEDGKIYALKSVKISQLNTKEQENALNEVRVLASITHPNIIGYKEAFFEEDTRTLNIVMEYADDGDLESKISNHIKNKTNFAENDIWSYLIQMIEGLKALHEIKIMHRDLKSANVFMMKNGLIKLGDLNVSKVVKNKLVYTQTGTPYYASPEVWADKPYDYKSDIWSVGCVLYELCVLKPPFRGKSLEELYKNVTRGHYDSIPNVYSTDLHKIVSVLLQTNPHNRPSCESFLSNPIILKRMDYNKNFGYGGNNQLLNTIKLPRNISEINQKLPKTKKYVDPTGLTMLKNKDEEKLTLTKELHSDNLNKIEKKEHSIPVSHILRAQSAKPAPRSLTPAGVSSSNSRREAPHYSSNTPSCNSNINLGNNINNPKPIRNIGNNIGQPIINPLPNSNRNISVNNSKNIQKPILGYNSQINSKVRASSARPISRIGSNLNINTSNQSSHGSQINNSNQHHFQQLNHYQPRNYSQKNDYRHISPAKALINNNINQSGGGNIVSLTNNISNNYGNNNSIPTNKVPVYEYKSPYKPSVKQQIFRPTTGLERNGNSHSSSNTTNNSQNNSANKVKLIIDNPEHKILVQPIKIVENSKRIPSANNINNMNVVNNLYNGNSFLKVIKPQGAENNRIMHNIHAKPISLYRK